MKKLRNFIDTLKSVNPTELGVKGYNDFVKEKVDFEILTEMFFTDVLSYVNEQIGDEGIKALDKIIVRYDSSDWEKAYKVFENVFGGYKRQGVFKEKIFLKDVENALKVLKIDINNNQELLQSIQALLTYEGREIENPKEAIKECLKGNDDSLVLDEILAHIARQYFEWFYFDLDYCIKNVIDFYSENNICIKKPIIHSFIARKDSQLNKLNRDLHDLLL